MRSLFIFLAAWLLTKPLTAQTFAIYRLNSIGTAVTATITNGSGIMETTVGNNTRSTKFRIDNKAAGTVTYSVIRTIIAQVPTLNTGVAPETYFSFGTGVFPPSVSTPPPGVYITLPAMTNSGMTGDAFDAMLDEAVTLGFYEVGYKVFNTADLNDTLFFKIRYNAALGTGPEQEQKLFSASVFPNPAGSEVFVALNNNKENTLIEVFNSSGSKLHEQTVNDSHDPATAIRFDCSSLQSGLYNVRISSSGTTVTRRFIVYK